MGTPDTKLSDLLDLVRSWIHRRTEPVNMARDFWMPDQSCLVCYDCDSPFTIFNRRHHCRLCGRVFCGSCTENSIPANSEERNDAREDRERIRVCNYCFKQWEQAIAGDDNGVATEPTPRLSHSPSAASLVSSKSSCSSSSSSASASTPYSTGPYQHVPYSDRFVEMDHSEVKEVDAVSSRSIQQCEDIEDGSSNNYFTLNRSDDESDEYDMYHLQYGPVSMSNVDNIYIPYGSHLGEDNTDAQQEPYHSFPNNAMDETKGTDEEVGEPYEPSNVSVATAHEDAEPVDFENNVLLWLPPEPADKEDEREALMLDENDGEGASGEWGYLRSKNSFGSGDYRNKDKTDEEHRHAMKNVLESHFRVLIAQLLQVENLPAINEEGKDNWLDIITCLSWESATMLKPDMSKGGGMDPGGYVKVKCIASGRPSESKVVKGVVCKKNVAHRRMTSNIEKPRFLILGGALEYQRVSNHLSSVDTLLQQEMDHLKMAVAKIDAHHPDILLVEKSVSRYAQDYILAKDISLVLNIRRPLLERIARCTGAQILPSVDHLTSPKLGYCDAFHVEKFFEEHGSAGQGGKKLTKTLMFFEGCPKPFGCTVLLKGAKGDDLKKIKHVVQYGVFAAYHLALETSFLADEGASLPELLLKSPITVALPDKATFIERSISTVSGFPLTPGPKPLDSQPEGEVDSVDKSLFSNGPMSAKLPHSPSEGHFDQNVYDKSALTVSVSQLRSFENIYGAENNMGGTIQDMRTDLVSNPINSPDTMNEYHGQVIYETATAKKDEFSINPETVSAKEEFSPSPSPSEHRSILVSLSSRCGWKGTVCEKAHLFRIKYYGSFDKPLGRFLRDHLLDQSYRCNSCELPSEAHVHCYTHRQGSLTISVRKLQDINIPGERDGKIWMWHRCLKCPRKNGFPQATQRVVMSNAAWGLSFGKFLELSFSNHAAASRVANCGHSLHRDCLRFYGFGRMVACFRYASINVLSVYLPPSKVDFNYSTQQEWIQKEVKEMCDRAKLLFIEVSAAVNRIRDKLHSAGQVVDNPKASNVGSLLEESEILLLKDKLEIEETLGKVLSGHRKAIDILEINKLRKQIIQLSYTWDQHLISVGKMVREVISSSTKSSEKPADSKLSPAKRFASSDSLLMVEKADPTFNQTPPRNESIKRRDEDQESNYSDVDSAYLSANEDIGKSDSFGSEKVVRIAFSEGEFPVVANLTDTFNAAWIGESQRQPSEDKSAPNSSLNSPEPVPGYPNISMSRSLNLPKSNSFMASLPSISISRSLNLPSSPKPNFMEYSPLYVQSFWESERLSGAKLLLPSTDTVIPVYDDEPTSIISFALVSNEYLFQSLNGLKDGLSSTTSLPLFDSVSLLSFSSLDESGWDPTKSFISTAGDELLLRSPQNPDPLSSTRDLHIRVSFMDENPQGKVKYGVVCYYGKQFEALRRICCPSETDYVRSLSRCKKWGAQGGKSNVFFAKTLDDRFIIKQVTKTELESFIKFAPAYFKYLSESIGSGSPTCLAKILGIYQVTSKHLKGGKETKMDVLVMENLLFQRNITRLYDLKGSARSRYNSDTSGNNKVLLDQNLIEAMPTSPIFVGNKAKRLLERAVWNDTAFLALIDVMDYSLLVGVDEERHELVLGIIDFVRQYTWDKHLETWVKTSAILGGSKTESPTVISPQMYKKRFRKAMTAYFLMVPDQWSPPPAIIPASRSQIDLTEEATTAD